MLHNESILFVRSVFLQQVRGPWPWEWHCQSQQDLFRALAVFSRSHENSPMHQFNKTYQNDLQTEITSLLQLKNYFYTKSGTIPTRHLNHSK